MNYTFFHKFLGFIVLVYILFFSRIEAIGKSCYDSEIVSLDQLLQGVTRYASGSISSLDITPSNTSCSFQQQPIETTYWFRLETNSSANINLLLTNPNNQATQFDAILAVYSVVTASPSPTSLCTNTSTLDSGNTISCLAETFDVCTATSSFSITSTVNSSQSYLIVVGKRTNIKNNQNIFTLTAVLSSSYTGQVCPQSSNNCSVIQCVSANSSCTGFGCQTTLNDALCSDGINCTLDLCLPTGCAHIEMNNWCPFGSSCYFSMCSIQTGGCIQKFLCDDGLSCTTDTCVNGVCSYVADNSLCNDNISCTVDICDTNLGTCRNIPNVTACGSDSCDIYYCDPLLDCQKESIVAKGLCSDDIACTLDSCSNGSCIHAPQNNLCDDGIACTLDECSISLGKCQNIPQSSLCNDNDSCTIDSCSCILGCVYEPLTCDDGLPCTIDSCNGGKCVYVPDNAACDDGIACTNDICNVALGKCQNLPVDSLCPSPDDIISPDNCLAYFCSLTLGCVNDSKVELGYCSDDIYCTIDSCDSVTGNCIHTPIDSMCNDGGNCTVDYCSLNLGKCVNYPNASLCDDGNACTEDFCNFYGNCIHAPKHCDDGIYCTVDTCAPSTGCIHTPQNALCDDGTTCTVDICNVTLGSCLNFPDDALCTGGSECTLNICNPIMQMCEYIPQNYYCEDEIFCTLDTCDITLGCIHTPNNSLCNDYINCTENVCTLEGCIFVANNSLCSDGIDCTLDVCNPNLRMSGLDTCQYFPQNSLCNDNVTCTVDTCSLAQGCLFAPNNDLCSDNIGCTIDQCDPTYINPIDNSSCTHTPENSLCDDGYSCSNKTCSVTLGTCVFNYSLCPWYSPNFVCINCMSTGSRIQQICYTDGTGALQLQTRNTSYPTTPVNDGTGLNTNVLLTPDGAVVLGASTQMDVLLHKSDGLVIDTNFRILPVPQSQLPPCNFIRRGMISVVEAPIPCEQNNTQICTFDTLYICLQEQAYIWKQIA